MSLRWWVLAAGLLCLCGCVPFVRYKDVTETFEQLADGSWSYIDEDLDIRFRVEPGPQFVWRFKNTSLLEMSMDHRNVALFLENDPTAYTLWGKPRLNQPGLPVLALKPGDFIQVGYPVQVNSPLFPFSRKTAVLFDFVIEWHGRPTSYRLVIPALPEEKEPEAPLTSDEVQHQ